MSRKDRLREQKRFGPSDPHSPLRAPHFPWGYVLGGGLCLVALVVLSVALGNALRSATRGVHMFQAPGIQELELKNGGVYVGVYPHKGEGAVPVAELAALDFSVVDGKTGAPLPLERSPEGAVYHQAGQTGAVLFQFEAARPGKYVLRAFSAADAAAPRQMMLVHESLQQNRSDIAAGAIFFLVLAGFGIYVLIKTYKAEAGRNA